MPKKKKPTITRKLAIKELREQQASGDTEEAHAHADRVLCELLTKLGYADVVDEYSQINKWYA